MQGKTQNVQCEEKGGTRKWNRAKSGVQEDKQINKIMTLNGIKDLRARVHPTKLPTCEGNKEIFKDFPTIPCSSIFTDIKARLYVPSLRSRSILGDDFFLIDNP